MSHAISDLSNDSRSRHFDLVGGDNPWSIDMVVEVVSCILLVVLSAPLVTACIH
jgi:hypothetical protein